MKKFHLIAAAILAGGMLASCGASKSVATDAPKSGKTVVVASEAQQYAEDAPKGVLRAWGEYTGDEYGFTKRYADALARATLAEQVSVKVVSGVEMYRNSMRKGNITKEGATSVRDTEGQDQQRIFQVCEEFLKGASIVKTSAFQLENGLYQIVVCAEADTKALVEYLSDQEEVVQLISENERIQIEYNRDKFRETITAELER